VNGAADASRLGRSLQALLGRLRGALQDARGLLRREAWSEERLRAAAVAALRRPLRSLAVLAGALLLPLLLRALLGGAGPESALGEVREGPFRVSIVETGTLQALRSVSYASRIQSNQAKIVALAPEGKLVEKGDLLILFDTAPFEDEIRTNQAALAQAEAELQKTRQDLRLQQIQNGEELLAARQRTQKSELELQDVMEGKGLLKEDEASAAVTNAERELQKSESAFEDLKPLLKEGFITKLELERAEQQVTKSKEELQLARRRRDALLQFGRPLERSQAQAEALSTRESLKQLESAAQHRLDQRRAAIAAAESRVREASQKLALAQQQVARSEVRADVRGIVVYRDVFFGSEQRKPQVGDQVWANQPLLILPDVSRMTVETKVRETDVHKVEKNQKVEVRVDAYPDLRLKGAVTLIGTLAQEERERRGPKFFGVTIELSDSEPRLRPGMTARVEIQVEERPRALYVPLEAVFERDGRALVYVPGLRGPREREVALGPSNQDFVVVERGLRRGERVLLRDPLAASSEPASPQ
jgi:HlyD family secretion protein